MLFGWSGDHVGKPAGYILWVIHAGSMQTDEFVAAALLPTLKLFTSCVVYGAVKSDVTCCCTRSTHVCGRRIYVPSVIPEAFSRLSITP
jgi:hypothetical protein